MNEVDNLAAWIHDNDATDTIDMDMAETVARELIAGGFHFLQSASCDVPDCDDLAVVVKEVFRADSLIVTSTSGADVDDSDFHDVAEDILAAGYRKPRTITTAEELIKTRAGLAVADQAWREGASAATRAAGGELIHPLPNNPYTFPLLRKIKEEGDDDE